MQQLSDVDFQLGDGQTYQNDSGALIVRAPQAKNGGHVLIQTGEVLPVKQAVKLLVCFSSFSTGVI